MRSDTITVKGLFQDRRQYRVPFYQRHYVWNQKDQWEPLWQDITEKAEGRLVPLESSPPHFLGAIVLELQHKNGLKGVETFHVIDGQQRLTTLQYLLTALALIVRERKIEDLYPVVETFTRNNNPDMMNDPTSEIYKVWPTFPDRPAFIAAMTAETRDALRQSFPQSFTNNGDLRKIGCKHPPALEAIWFFAKQIDQWLVLQDDHGNSLEKLSVAILHDLKLVDITLEKDDDAQVIFETLNARGVELNAADLIRNHIFMNVSASEDAQTLYNSLWKQFEDPFWSDIQRRGRLKRPRLEWFVQSTLQADMAKEIDVGRIYDSYRAFAEHKTATLQLQVLNSYAAAYRSFIEALPTTPIGWFGSQISTWDASPAHSLALTIATSPLPPDEQHVIFKDLVSYIVRRAICGLSNKSYNKVFPSLLKRTRKEYITPARVREALNANSGDASRWPTDHEFMRAWMDARFIERVNDIGRVRYVLTALEAAMRTSKSEEKGLPTLADVDVDHILPVQWYDHWPVDGVAVTKAEALQAQDIFALTDTSPRKDAINTREHLKQTIGNLTLIHYGVNRQLQNKAFSMKREEFFRHSNLHLNRTLMTIESWDEQAIKQRGSDLFAYASQIWPAATIMD